MAAWEHSRVKSGLTLAYEMGVKVVKRKLVVEPAHEQRGQTRQPPQGSADDDRRAERQGDDNETNTDAEAANAVGWRRPAAARARRLSRPVQ